MPEVEVTTPMDDIAGVEEYMVAENLQDGHNKVYILTHVKTDNGDRLVRFWGRHDSTLQTTDEVWSDDVFDKLVATKLNPKKGYDVLDTAAIMKQEVRYKAYRRQIEAYLKNQRYV